MENSSLTHSRSDRESDHSYPEAILSRLGSDTFANWYRRRERSQNVREGKHYFNGPSKINAQSRHSPSALLQCHRRTLYSYFNSPEETEDPSGIFWFGSRFEENVIMPYLIETISDDDTFARNSLWVDYTIETDAGEIQFKGETDPVIVDEHSTPLLLLEIKTKRSIEDLNEPNIHHKAQVHAYLRGLNEKYEVDLDKAAIIYGSRTTLDIEIFEIEFDQEFWDEVVLQWAAEQTDYRTFGNLPPAEPEYDWECKFCSFRERCGRGDSEHSDGTPLGLLPVYSEYPRQKVIDYLDAHPGTRLTPTLANVYPDLIEEYDVYHWSCSACDSDFEWDAIDGLPESNRAPRCPDCHDTEQKGWLSGPTLVQQRAMRGEEDAR